MARSGTPTPPPAEPGELAERGTGIRVVLVEDHAIIREQLTRQLTEAGITVLAATATLQDGYQAISSHQPDVAVLDNHLPDGRGIDLCRRLHQAHPDIPTVIYSGHLTWEDREMAEEAGAAAVVPKTFTGRELISAITQHASMG